MRIGLIGLDGHTNEILDDLPSIPGAVLTAAARAEVGNDFSRLTNHPAITSATRYYNDPREMLDKEKLDIVGVCPPNYLIAPYATAAAERGIHVLAEKPLAIDLPALNRLREAVTRNKVRLAALFAMRHYPPMTPSATDASANHSWRRIRSPTAGATAVPAGTRTETLMAAHCPGLPSTPSTTFAGPPDWR